MATGGTITRWVVRYRYLLTLLSGAFGAGAYVTLHQVEIKKVEAQVFRVDSAKVSRDTVALFMVEVRGELRHIRAAVDSVNLRTRELACERAPRWCR